MVSYLGLAIAAGLGIWAYRDAKMLRSRGITVGSMPPAAWGWLVFLIAIIFGILYLVQRPKAIAAATRPPLDPPVSVPLPPPPPTTVRSSVRAPLDADAIARAVDPPPPSTASCTGCGTPAPAGAQFCPSCGAQLGDVEHE
jgi:hypothetical protein